LETIGSQSREGVEKWNGAARYIMYKDLKCKRGFSTHYTRNVWRVVKAYILIHFLNLL
jgi:hypothetical protein